MTAVEHTDALTGEVSQREAGVLPRSTPPWLHAGRIRRLTFTAAAIWSVVAVALVWWISNRITTTELEELAASANYENDTTIRVMERLFTEMESVS